MPSSVTLLSCSYGRVPVIISNMMASIPAYNEYALHRAFRLLHDFCSVQISAIYGNAMKDRLYCETPASPLRHARGTLAVDLNPYTLAERRWADLVGACEQRMISREGASRNNDRRRQRE